MPRSWAAALAAVILMAPVTALAQADTYSRVSFSASQMYDANLFATPKSRTPQADFITRFGPALEAGYRSLPIEFDARYEIQAERYLNHPDLDENFAHHDASVGVRYLPSDRFLAGVKAQFVRTQNPSEFNVLSQLSVGRTPAERRGVTVTAAYNLSEPTRIAATHAYGRDEMLGGFTTATNVTQLGIRRRTSDRSMYRIDYELRQVDFAGSTPIVSHVVTAGRSYSITSRTGLELTAGPRLTDGHIRPEIMAAFNRQVSWGELSLAFGRTELTAIGERGTIEVHRASATGRYRATRRLTISATPAFAHNARADRRAPVYTLDVESTLEMHRRLWLVATGRIGQQEGTLSGPREILPARSLAVKLLVTPPAAASFRPKR